MQSCLVYTPTSASALQRHHYGPSGLASTIIFNAPPRAARNTPAVQTCGVLRADGSERLVPGGLGGCPGPLRSISAVPLKALLHLLAPPPGAYHSRRILRPHHRNPSPRMVPIKDPNLDEIRILVGPPGHVQGRSPILEALKTEPTSIPFSKQCVVGAIWQISPSIHPSMQLLPDFCGTSRLSLR